MSILFSAVARRASPIVSKFGPCPLPFSPSSLIRFNPWLASTTPRSLSSLEGVRVSANERMKRMLEAAIRRREEFFVPKDFPFEVVDNSGEQMIALRRKYSGENIEVVAKLPDWLHKKEKVKEDEEYIDLTITIDKGENTYLEFSVFIFSKGIDIGRMLLKSHQVLEEDTQKYEGPEIWSLEETLHRAAVKYLKAKGIDGSLWEFLKKYMMDKNEREHLDWLKKIIGFFTM